jgi:hypothetical protein
MTTRIPTLQEAIRNAAIDDVLKIIPAPVCTDEFMSLIDKLREIPSTESFSKHHNR